MRVRGTLLSAVAVLSVATAVRSQAPTPAEGAGAAPTCREADASSSARRSRASCAAPTASRSRRRWWPRRPSSSDRQPLLRAPDAVSTRTDAGGRFRLVLRKHEPQTVRVEAPGLAAATRKDVEPGTPLAFDLTAAERSKARSATATPDSRPRTCASSPCRTDAIAVPDVPESGRVVARTDANGRFNAEGLATGCTASPPAAAGAVRRTRLGAARDAVDLVVFPSGSVSGPCGERTAAVPGATVNPAARPWGWARSSRSTTGGPSS
jgi:hypothetical protein